MKERGRILIADDEEVSLLSTIELLRREDLECDGVKNANTAMEMLRNKEYGLLISDIRMPGNMDLELINEARQFLKNLPVIIVTGYPSVKTAITCLHLCIIAYLVKSLDFDEFMSYVKTGVKSSQLNRDLFKLKKRLMDWDKNIEIIKDTASLIPPDPFSVSINNFLTLTYQNIGDTLLDLMYLAKVSEGQTETKDICHLLNCPRLNSLRDALIEAVGVLEKAQNAFKSKDLGDLRKRFNEIVKNMDRGK